MNHIPTVTQCPHFGQYPACTIDHVDCLSVVGVVWKQTYYIMLNVPCSDGLQYCEYSLCH